MHHTPPVASTLHKKQAWCAAAGVVLAMPTLPAERICHVLATQTVLRWASPYHLERAVLRATGHAVDRIAASPPTHAAACFTFHGRLCAQFPVTERSQVLEAVEALLRLAAPQSQPQPVPQPAPQPASAPQPVIQPVVVPMPEVDHVTAPIATLAMRAVEAALSGLHRTGSYAAARDSAQALVRAEVQAVVHAMATAASGAPLTPSPGNSPCDRGSPCPGESYRGSPCASPTASDSSSRLFGLFCNDPIWM